jgi:hypothetical protein
MHPPRRKNLLLRAVSLGATATMVGSAACGSTTPEAHGTTVEMGSQPESSDGGLGKHAEDGGTHGIEVADAGRPMGVIVEIRDGATLDEDGRVIGSVLEEADGGTDAGQSMGRTAEDAGRHGLPPEDAGVVGKTFDAAGVGLAPADGG